MTAYTRSSLMTRVRWCLWLVMAAWMLSCQADAPTATSLPGVEVVGETVPAVSVSPTAQTEVPAEHLGVLHHDYSSFLNPDPIVDTPFNDFLFGEVYSGLFRIGGGLEGILEPDVASSFQISEDGLQYTFLLRENLRFSDGTSVTADDVKWSWERALNPDSGSQRARDVLGAIRGADAVLSGDAESLAGVQVIDDSTVRVELTSPLVHFPYLLVDPMASVLSKANFAKWGTAPWDEFLSLDSDGQPPDLDFEELPVGTGPFRIADFGWDRGATLEPNPYYWDTKPRVASVEFKNLYSPGNTGILRQPSVSEFDFMESDLELYEAFDGPMPPTLDGESLGVFDPVVRRTAPGVTFLALNTALPPYDDVEFRRALVLSVTPTTSVSWLWQGAPSIPARGLLPPDFPGHGSDPWATAPNHEVALEHLWRSRYSDAEAAGMLTFVRRGDDILREFFLDYTSNWVAQLGVTVEFVGLEDAPLNTFDTRLEEGTLEMRYEIVRPRYPDPHAILGMIPGLFGPNAESDETRELAAMLADAAVETDRVARIAKYQAIERHILDRALVIPVFWDDGTTYELVKPYIHGYKRPAYYGSRYKDVTIDTTHPDYPADRLSQ